MNLSSTSSYSPKNYSFDDSIRKVSLHFSGSCQVLAPNPLASAIYRYYQLRECGNADSILPTFLNKKKLDTTLKKDYCTSKTNELIAVHLQSESIECLRILTQHLNSLLSLKDNWDGYGAIPIYREVVKKAQWFLRVLPSEYLRYIENDNITPNTNGTLTIDFEDNEGGVVSISMGVEYDNFYFDVNDKPIAEAEKITISPDENIPFLLKKCLDSLGNKSK